MVGGFRDGPNFNPHFDGPPDDFFRGPGGPRMRPPMFNDGPPRFRGHRFDDRSWDRPDPDFEDLEHGPPPAARQGRRSRWGDNDGGDEQVPGEEIIEEFNRSSTTPVYDECPAPEETESKHDDQRENSSFQEQTGGGDESFPQCEANFQEENIDGYQADRDNIQERADNYENKEDLYHEDRGNLQGEENFQVEGDNLESAGDVQGNGADFHESNLQDGCDVPQSVTEGNGDNTGEPVTE